MSVLLADDRPTARKRHQCFTCFEPIEVGTRYASQRIADSGGIHRFKTHEPCLAIEMWCRRKWSLDEYDIFELDDDAISEYNAAHPDKPFTRPGADQ
jgi:hypothetical protein